MVAKNKKKTSTKRSKTNVLARRIRNDNSTGVAEYLNMLRDPCNATPVRAPYVGTGGGVLLRTRTIITPSATAVDAAVAIQPGWIDGIDKSVVADWVTTQGTPLTTAQGWTPAFPIAQDSFGQRRILAGCIKVHYTGTEMNRQGMVYLGVHHERVFTAAGFLSAQSVNSYVNKAHRTARLGSESHEARYLPLSVSDQEWWGREGGIPANDSSDGSTAVAVVRDAPAGKFYFEVVLVWECRPGTWGNSGLVDNSVVTPPSFGLDKAFSIIGDIQAFATNPHVQSFGRAMVGMAANYAFPSSASPRTFMRIA